MAKRYRKTSRSGKRKMGTTVFVIILILVLGIGIKIYIDGLLNIDTFYEGITIDGMPMNGLTRESAERSLIELNQPRLDNLGIKLVYQSKSWEYDHDDMEASLDIKEKIDGAYNIGREGGFISRFLTVQRLKKQEYSLNTELTYNVDRLKDDIEQIASEIDEEPVDATVTFHPDEKVTFVVSPEQEGSTLDVEEVMAKLKEVTEKDAANNVITLSPEKVPPKVSAKDFEGKLEKIIAFGTDLSKSAEDRTNNIVTAAKAFHGMIVEPDQIVSFNETTGKRTKDKGYRYAPMIHNKRFVDVLGGGVSQTSTTLYNTVIRAGLEVVEKSPHSLPSSYMDMGLDTTVNIPPPEPTIDLKFRNTRTSPIYLRAYYYDKKVYFEIYGEPLPDGQNYEFRSETYETIPGPAPEILKDYDEEYVEYEDEEYVHVTPRDGYKVRVYKQIFQNGNLIEEELFDSHVYSPVKGKIYVGIKKRNAQQDI